jgi:hypothetical protein
MKLYWSLVLCLLALLPWAPVQANDYAKDPFDPAVARDAWLMIAQAERQNQIPPGLLHAMSLVETGQGIRGWMLPWPYTVGINGTGKKTYRSALDAGRQINSWRGLGFVRFNVSVNGRNHSNIKTAEALATLAPVGTGMAFITVEGRNFARRFDSETATEVFLTRLFAQGYNNVDIGMMQVNWRVHGKRFSSLRAALNPTNNLQYAVNYLLTHRQTRDWWGSVGRYHSGTAVYANRYIRNVYGMYMRIHKANNNA